MPIGVDRDEGPDTLEELVVGEPAPEAGEEGAAEADGGQRLGRETQRAAGAGDALGLFEQGEGAGREQAADEAAAGLVVPAPEDEDREGEERRKEHARGGTEDQRIHRAGPAASLPARRAAIAATPAITITEISPSVSKPRKSTRITLTML